MIPNWPAELLQKPLRNSWRGGPMDQRRAFQPDFGPPITRPGATATTMLYSGAVFRMRSPADRALFEAWFEDDLARGSVAFAWRDPETDIPGLWLIPPGERAWEMTSIGAGISHLTISLMRQPGAPWWGDYMLDGDCRVPAVVADYGAGVFGVDGETVLAAAVAAVAGTFDLYTWPEGGGAPTIELAEAVTAGDIPASAPTGVTRIVGYLP